MKPSLPFRRLFHFWAAYTFMDLRGTNSEEDSLVLLSDGGHHDNLAVTALTARRCRLVISLDATGDPGWSFEDLSRTAGLLDDVHLPDERRCRLDADASVLDALRPAKPEGTWAERAVAHPVLDTKLVCPSTKEETRFLYVKAALPTAACLPVRIYAESHAQFPQDSTANQFFDDAQFDAYLRLGEHLADCVANVLARDEEG